MYKNQGQPTISVENFKLPFNGKLSEDNRWVVMASLIPWSELEKEHSSSIDVQAPVNSFRMLLGALIIKEKLGMKNKEIVELIKENPYLQYFIGLPSYSNKVPFDASILASFSEKISTKLVSLVCKQINEKMR